MENDRALIQRLDGSILRVPMSSLDPSDQLSIRACETLAEATEALRFSPYSDSRIQLERVHKELTAHGVIDSWAREIALFPDSTSKRPHGDRKLEQLDGRWVEIRGLQYQVSDVEVASDGVGISHLMVRTERNERIAVTPEWAAELKILPSFWRYATYRPQSSGDPHFFRGPPSAETLRSDLQWRNRLTFDESISAWTDAKSVEFHEKREHAREQWEEAYSLGRVAESKWHVHRGDDRLVKWEASQSREHLGNAYKEYTAAIQLVPSYADAYLRRAATCMVADLDVAALRDLNEALTLAPNEKYIVMPGLEMRSRIHSRTPINSGELIALAERHGAETIRLTQENQKSQTRSKIAFAGAIVADHWVTKWRFSEKPENPDGQQNEVTSEAQHRQAQERHRAAVLQAWVGVKDQLTRDAQDFRTKMAHARAQVKTSADHAFWMHDHAISDADRLVALASQNDLRVTTEDIPPKYLGSPVHAILLRLDAEEGLSRYHRLLTLVRGVAADATAGEASSMREQLSRFSFATSASESEHVSAFRASARSAETNILSVAGLDMGVYALTAESAVSSDVLLHIASKAVNYSAPANRARYQAMADDILSLTRSYPAAIRDLARRLGGEERSLAYTLVEDAFVFGLIFSADSSFRRLGPVPEIRREQSGVGAAKDVLDTYIYIERAKELVANGDYAQAIFEATSALETAPDANLKNEASNVLVNAVINHVNSFPVSVGFGF